MTLPIMQDSTNDHFPIRTVSEITGVNAVTLRAWERRYGLVKPSRTPKGHRIYSRDDIRLIQQILDRLSQGVSIGQIARDMLDETAVEDDGPDNTWNRYAQRMIEAVADFDEPVLEAVYNDAMSLYPVDIVTTRLIMPLLQELGRRWETGEGSVAEEHFFSAYLRNKLGARFHHQNLRNNGPKLILACLPGEQHEFGMLLFALMAHDKGFRIIMLGADLPVDELQQVAARSTCQGIVLAGAATLGCDTLYEEIRALTESIKQPVFIGGEISYTCREAISQANAIPLGHDLAGGLYKIVGKLWPAG